MVLSGKGSLAELFVLNTYLLMCDVELNDRFKNLDATSLLVSTADSAVSQQWPNVIAKYIGDKIFTFQLS